MGQQQSKEELLFQKVSQSDVEGIKSLRHKGAGLEWVDKKGRTPLILACTKSKLYDVAETLVKLGSNVNAYRSGSNAGTPLHHAAKRGLEKKVKLLLSHGANPLVLNDDFETPLDVARAKGYSNVVRAIESHICLFSGWMREFYGPSFLEVVAPQLLSRRVWVVVVPTGSRNPSKPFRLELVVYSSLEDAQPRTVMPLWKANLEEPKSDQSDASVMIVDNSRSPMRRRARRRRAYVRRWARGNRVQDSKYVKLAAATKGDIQQLNWFCEACKGFPQKFVQPMNPPVFQQTSQTTTNENSISVELTPSAPPDDGSIPYPTGNCENEEDGEGYGECEIGVDASSETVCDMFLGAFLA